MTEKLFHLTEKGANVRTELLAGLTTFMTMAYILMVNAGMFAELPGVSYYAIYVATALSAAIGTILIGLLANLPLAQASAMGSNAFFVYTVCMGFGLSYANALVLILLDGIAFVLLTVTGLRKKIFEAIPAPVRLTIPAGVGLFIAFIGMQNSQIIVNSDATLVTLGNITSGPALLGMIGVVITAVLLILKIRGALLLGILITTLVGIPMGITQLDSVFGIPPSIDPIFMKFEWDSIFTTEMALVVFTFLFVDIFDTLGTLVGVSTRAGMVDKNGRIPHLKKAFLVDAIGTTTGAMLGSSTVTTFVESASGVAEGGRTGLTAFVTSICFLIALFFAPFFLAVPGAATAPVLIIVGLMMMSQLQKLDFNDYSESVPAFICVIFMPLSYSISEGIALGLLSFVLINLITGKAKKITVATAILACFFVLKYVL